MFGKLTRAPKDRRTASVGNRRGDEIEKFSLGLNHFLAFNFPLGHVVVGRSLPLADKDATNGFPTLSRERTNEFNENL